MNRIEDVYGLTPAQQGMYLQTLDNKAEAYNLYYLFELKNETDIQTLRQAIRLLAVRHPVLKTAFAVIDGEVKQVILTDRVPYTEAVNLDYGFSEEALNSIVKEKSAYSFDFQRDSLMRCFFICFSDKSFFLLHTHHLIADGWSMSVLLEDLTEYYCALADNTDYDLLKSRIEAERKNYTSFASYVNLIRAYDSNETENYWDNLLSDASVFTLPKATAVQNENTHIERRKVSIEPQLRERLEAFARSQRVTVNSVIECAFSLALQKHTGTSDLIYNKVISGKSIELPNLERTAGPMINTVPVRIKRSEDMTLSALLRQVHNQSVDANKYGFLSLSEIYRRNEIDPGDVDVIFAFGNYYAPVIDSEKSPFGLVSYREETEFPLTVNVFPDGEAYSVQCAFDCGGVSREFVTALENSFVEIARSITESDLQKSSNVSDFLQLTSEERKTVIYDFNRTSVPYDKTKGLYELLAEQARTCSQKQAVIFNGQSITYENLLQRVDETADRLKKAGVGASDVVAVYLDRSPLLIVLQLAVIKLGAVFLPADRRYPVERLRFLCKDCNVKLLITDADTSFITDCKALTPKELESIGVYQPHTPAVYSDNCYIIYTSGSTGAPKGCLLKQSGLVNFCINNNTLESLKRNQTNIFACVNSVAFDYFIAESLLPLLNGFSVVLCDENESLNQNAFFELVRKHGINVLMTTPTRLKLFYDEGSDCSCLKNLDCVCTSGEPLTAKLLKRIYEVSQKAVVYNPLGPSECTVWDLGGELDRNAGIDIHLGKPIANAQIYIVDKYMNPAPIGVTGELCIAGDGVGSGYLNRPELTAEKFVDNPFGEGKLYKTGDLAYWREDGNIVFVGRNDFQVKINGQRVEEADRQTLCAFYTGKETPASDLRTLLGKTLPRYMIPQGFKHLEAMPLNTSGKTDRKALEILPVETVGIQPSEFSPAQTPTEEAVCRAFCELFDIERVGRNDNFYDLGGTSLQLVQLLTQPPFDALSPADFLVDPTPAGVAEKLDNKGETEYTFVVPLYTPVHSKKAVVLFPYAGGDASAYTALTAKAREENSDISLFCVDWQNDKTMSDIENEILALSNKMSVCFYSHCAGSAVAMELLDRLNAEEMRIRNYIAGANIPPHGLAAGFNIWEHISDGGIINRLKKAGLNLNENDPSALHERLERFRRHTNIYRDYYKRKYSKTDVSVTAIISRNDPFTKNYADAEKHWAKVVTDVNKVVLIDTPSHYFNNTDTELLLNLFSETIN